MTFSLAEQIKEVKLEIMFRQSTYRKMVEQNRMRSDVAARRLAIMADVLSTLEELRAQAVTPAPDQIELALR